MTLHTDISTRWLLVYIDEPKFMQRELILKNPLSPKPTCWYELHIAENLTFIALLLLPCALPYLVASCLSLFSYFFSTKGIFFSSQHDQLSITKHQHLQHIGMYDARC